MVVRAADKRNGAIVTGCHPMPVGQHGKGAGVHRLGESAGKAVVLARAGAVATFPHAEEQHHPLDVPRRDRRTHPVERMSERVRQTAVREERLQLIDGAAEGLQIPVILLGQVPDEHVQRHIVLWEARRDLDRQKRVGQMIDTKRALNRVVVADRYETHTASTTNVIDTLRVGVGLSEPRPPERIVAAVGREPGMDMEVAEGRAHHHRL